ncbi:MAG: D-2-hydroxyacid dehydrogenase [Bacteroidetes bacterium]|nr:D-2-hydroxyacid dehydrogenase [Bacteroidota bacterium]MDA1119022.1 D-2-hydroxyacid dehydrogenase [Bacteroidota bacterium]
MGLKIVVTDGFTLNPGDLSWDDLHKIGQLTIYDRTSTAEVFSRAKDCEIILTNKTIIADDVLVKLKNLKYIGVTATGVNIVNLLLARKMGITVTNVPRYGTDSVAQHAMALILELSNHVGKYSADVNKGKWDEAGDWSYWDKPLTELTNKTLGIVGLGAIGQKVARIATSFGMKVVYHTPQPKNVTYNYVSMEELFLQSDVVSLHCPLNELTDQLVNSERLNLMKSTAFIINTGRGQLINETELAKALKSKRIAGAGLDVLSSEPPGDNPLIGIENCILTPHHAWATREARQRLMDITLDNIKAFIEGNPQNVVN